VAPPVLLAAPPEVVAVAVAAAAAATERSGAPGLMLINPTSLLLFVTGAIILLFIPGPAVLYIVSRSIAHGRSAGLISALGIAVGTLFHVAAATFGLSALLASSALAFQFVKYAGAAYLVFLGIGVLQGRREDILNTYSGQTNLPSIFAQGVLVNLLNPKTALFFLSFLPQFVSPARGHATLQIFQLGVLFALMAWLTDSTWALLAGIVAARLRGSPHLRRVQRNVSGGALILLGLASAFSGARTK
jgi:threonine/homoserine/homoserine lactone efflux protein